MKFFRHTVCLAICTLSLNALAEADHHNETTYRIDEEIVVSAPFKESSAKTALPVGVLSGEQLSKQVTSTLGDTLRNQLGVHNSSFGTGVGLPVIRGQAGTRVQVLNDGISLTDVSKLSPDHGNAIEPALGQRIEIIRGPATLLYGNGAIGGVVNVIDERVPEFHLDRPEFTLEQSVDTAADERKTVLKLNASADKVNLHIDGFTRENKNVDVHGYAIDEAAVHLLEMAHEHEEDEEEDEDHEEEEIINSKGFIANSDAKSDGVTLGFSFSSDLGFFGVAANDFSHNYGLPPGSHDHNEEEGEEEGEEDHHEEGQEFVRIDMESKRYDLRGGLNFEDNWVQSLGADISFTDYAHDEIEIEASGERLLGTRYTNEGLESRFTLTHRPMSDWTGVLGLQFSDTEFEALGDEAFIPKTEKRNIAAFVVERLETDRMTWELGARLESTDLSPTNCDKSESSFSISASMIAPINAESNFMVALSRSERAPTIEERYSNISVGTCAALPEDRQVLHAATGLFEVGNPSLGKETSSNLELAYRKHLGDWTAEVSAYYNQAGDYIFLNLTEADHGAFAARDATFYGVEGKVTWQLPLEMSGDTHLSMQADYVRGRFDGGGNREVPRMPPARLGLHLAHHAEQWSVDMSLNHAFKQDKTTSLETATSSYSRLELYGDYRWKVRNDAELLIFLRGANLLDEEIRNHTSLLKNYAPEPGLNLRLGLRFSY